MKRTNKLADRKAINNNILFGRALPPHLARSPAGNIIGKATPSEKEFNDAIAKEAHAKINKAPLIAYYFNHSCRCGNTWQSFGFFARDVTIRIAGEASANCRQALDYDPAPERPSSVIFQKVDEQYCAKCAVPSIQIPDETPPSLPPVILSQYRHKAAEEVDAIRQDAITQQIKAYTARAVKRVTEVLPYGLEDAIPALPELAASVKRAADTE